MAFISELLTYSFKYIILLAVAVVAAICGAKYRKNKLAKASADTSNVNIKNTETKN